MGCMLNDKKFNFYVISDLNKDVFFTNRFDDFEEALNAFSKFESDNRKLPAMGIETPTGSLDLIHNINGDKVLVRDYLNIERFSKEVQAIKGEIERYAQRLVNEGAVEYRYSGTVVPWNDLSVKTIVPVVADFVPDTYCQDKILKAADGIAAVAINEILVNGNGWVKYDTFLNDPYKYVNNGVLKVDMVNVAYVNNGKYVGVDGQMDLSVDNFEAMADKINKPYFISVYDSDNRRLERRNFTVMSFDTLPEAVKAWYEVNANTEFTPGVCDRKNRCTCVFNGCDGNFKDISYEEAARIYGFDKVNDIDKLIHNATEVSKKTATESKVRDNVEFEHE